MQLTNKQIKTEIASHERTLRDMRERKIAYDRTTDKRLQARIRELRTMRHKVRAQQPQPQPFKKTYMQVSPHTQDGQITSYTIRIAT